MEKNRKGKWAKRILLSLLVIFLLCIAAVIAFVVGKYNDAYDPVDIVDRTDTYVMPDYPELDPEPPSTDNGDPDAPGTDTAEPAVTLSGDFDDNMSDLSVYMDVPIYRVEQKDPDIRNILLLGTDSRNSNVDRGRSDAMIVISQNKKTGEIKMVSFLRDSLVPIEGFGWNRLNAAYIFGGVGLAINTINQLYGLDIQRFIVVDMEGAKEFIDHIGGVELTLTQAEADYCNYILHRSDITPGVCRLDSAAAMIHLRNRAVDSDFGRTKRQRDVITSIANEVLREKSLSEILDLTDYAASIVSTNIDVMEMTDIVTSVVSHKDELGLTTQSVPFTDAYQSGWYNGMMILSYDLTAAGERIGQWLYGETAEN